MYIIVYIHNIYIYIFIFVHIWNPRKKTVFFFLPYVKKKSENHRIFPGHGSFMALGCQQYMV